MSRLWASCKISHCDPVYSVGIIESILLLLLLPFKLSESNRFSLLQTSINNILICLAGHKSKRQDDSTWTWLWHWHCAFIKILIASTATALALALPCWTSRNRTATVTANVDGAVSVEGRIVTVFISGLIKSLMLCKGYTTHVVC